jgi:hypothetical protein
MVPFVMRDIGEVRRQELLATGAYLELVKRLSAGGAERSTYRSWRRIVSAIRVFTLNQSIDRRYCEAVVLAGGRR